MTTAEALAIANQVKARQPSKVQSATLQKRIADDAAALAKSFNGMATTITSVNNQVDQVRVRLANIEKQFPYSGKMQ